MKFIFAIFSFLISVAPPTKTPDVPARLCISSEEQKMYDLLMAYRKEKKLPPIPLSENMTVVAQAHARDLSDNYEFDPDGPCNPHSWSKKGKWTPCCYTNDHKEAACMWNKPREISAYPGDGFEIAYYSSDNATAEEGIESWKSSPGHNPVMINTGTWSKVQWNAVGVGIHGNYGVIWFGREPDEKGKPVKRCD